MYLGSFDPVHTAHIDIPCKIIKNYDLEKIIFVPTCKSPVGRNFFASYSDRVNMIKNAIKGYKFFTISTFESTSEKISFTIDTVHYFKKKFKMKKNVTPLLHFYAGRISSGRLFQEPHRTPSLLLFWHEAISALRVMLRIGFANKNKI